MLRIINYLASLYQICTIVLILARVSSKCASNVPGVSQLIFYLIDYDYIISSYNSNISYNSTGMKLIRLYFIQPIPFR